MRKPSYRIVDGFRMPMGFPTEALRSALGFRARAGDVIVATYPKCGTTWVQYIIYLLYRGGRPLPAEAKLGDVFPHVEEVGLQAVEALPAPRLVKTHLPATMLSVEPGARYVHVARNPFDCVVSFYHHTRGFPRHYDFADGAFDDFFECFIRGEVDFGDYFEHLTSWYAHAGEPNVLFLTYESLKRATAEHVAGIGRFLGGAAAEAAANPGTLGAVVAESAFSRMSEHQQRWSSERPADLPFVRKGRVGDWRAHLSPDQARRLLERLEIATEGTPAAELWARERAEARAFSLMNRRSLQRPNRS